MGLKIACPGCAKALVIKQTPPVRIRCPGCRTRLQIAAEGTVRQVAGEVAAGDEPEGEGARGSALVIAGVGGSLLAIGVVVLLVVLSQGRGVEEKPAPPTAPETVVLGAGPGRDPTLPPEGTTVVAWAAAKGIPPLEGASAVAKEGDPGMMPVVKGPAPPKIVLTSVDGHPGVDGAAVNAAIDKGVAYLRRSKNGSPGPAALAGLTLLSCGVPAGDADVRWLAEQVRRGAAANHRTYDTACCIWFLDKLNEPGDADLIRSLAVHLIASQRPRGGWDYAMVRLSSQQEGQLLDLLRSQEVYPAVVLPKGARGAPVPVSKRILSGAAFSGDMRTLPVMTFRPGDRLAERPLAGHEDNSLTQFAVLALWAAQKHGVPAGRSLAMAEARFRESQAGNGTWGYTWGNSSRSDSMTCAGLLGLAVGRGSRLAAPGKGTVEEKGGDPAIENGLRHIAQRLQAMGAKTIAGTAPLPPPPDPAELRRMMTELYKKRTAARTPAERDAVQRAILDLQTRMRAALPIRTGGIVGANGWGDLYFLWSIERMAVVYDLRTIGGCDWYAFGAPRIVAAQRADGSWSAGHAGVPDTCFALLFLKRTNVAQTLTVALQGLGLTKDAGERGQAQGQQPTFIRGAGQLQGTQNNPQLQGTNKLQ